MKKYRYEANQKTLELLDFDKVLDFCSEPVELGEYIYFIQPYEWECKGDLVKLNLRTGRVEQILVINSEDHTVKYVYIENQTIFLLIGYLWGTVNQGGDLYKCDLNLENLVLLNKFDDKIQITSIASNLKGSLNLNGFKYLTDDFNESKEITIKFKI